MDDIAQYRTRELAIQAIERHILDVAQGRIRLGLQPDEVDQYLQDEYARLDSMKPKRLMV